MALVSGRNDPPVNARPAFGSAAGSASHQVKSAPPSAGVEERRHKTILKIKGILRQAEMTPGTQKGEVHDRQQPMPTPQLTDQGMAEDEYETSELETSTGTFTMRRQTAEETADQEEVKADREEQKERLELLKEYPCDQGCNGNGACLVLNLDLPPLREPTEFGSGCECDYPTWAGPACEIPCPTAPVLKAGFLDKSEEDIFNDLTGLSRAMGSGCAPPCDKSIYNMTALTEVLKILQTLTTTDAAAVIAAIGTSALTTAGIALRTPITALFPSSCADQGTCGKLDGICQCNFGYAGHACQYKCLKGLGGQVCSGTALGNCTFNNTAMWSSGCHPDFPQCLNQSNIHHGISCLCRGDTRGPACEIMCPKDEYGRVCSSNGTCDRFGVCQCNPGSKGSYCQLGILNETYKHICGASIRAYPGWPDENLPDPFTDPRNPVMVPKPRENEAEDWWPTEPSLQRCLDLTQSNPYPEDAFDNLNPGCKAGPASCYWDLTARRFHQMASFESYNAGVLNQDKRVFLFGGVGRAKVYWDYIFDAKTRESPLNVVTNQNSYQQMWYWNHKLQQWKWQEHQCYSADDDGFKVILSCTTDQVVRYTPSARFGHQLVTLSDQQGFLLHGGYSKQCADYCKDIWHFNLQTNIWTLLNMTSVPIPREVTEQEYETLFGLGATDTVYLSNPEPPKRWLQSLSAMEDNTAIMYGGYNGAVDKEYCATITAPAAHLIPSRCSDEQVAVDCRKVCKTGGYMQDLWIFRLDLRPEPSNMRIYGYNQGLWTRVDSTRWHLDGGRVPPPRRAHSAIYAHKRLFIHGGQEPDPYKPTDMGRERYSRSALANSSIWEWNSFTNKWRIVNPVTLDGHPPPRYMHAYVRFKDCLIIHGGYFGPEYRADLWSFNTTVQAWTLLSYEHRNALIYDPAPVIRYGHAMAAIDDSFIFHGGYGQKCVDEAMGTPDPDPNDGFEEDSSNFFCMPELFTYLPGQTTDPELSGKAKWFDDITGDITTDPSVQGNGATRRNRWATYYADTWIFNHTRCPHDCHGHGKCNLGYCVCDHHLGPAFQDHKAVRPTFWGSYIVGTNEGHWGYHCKWNMCHNTTCYYNFSHNQEFCRHCQYKGFCNGTTGRCHCDAANQQILPLHYFDQAISPYGEVGPDGKQPLTAEPVPFHKEADAFEMDERRRKDCQYDKCPHQFCSGHGYCTKDGICNCDPEYIGTACQYHAYCPQFCNYRGACVPRLLDPTQPWQASPGGTCDCHKVFNGTRCEIVLKNAAARISPITATLAVVTAMTMIALL